MTVPEILNSVESGIVFSAYEFCHNSSTHWIIDSGATCHISHNITCFSTLTPVHNMFVQLPNKTRVQVHCTVTVTLNSEFTLHNVFYIPNFNVNLLFVSA